MLTSALLVSRNSTVALDAPRLPFEVAGNVMVGLKLAHRSRSSRRVGAWLDELERDPAFADAVADARRGIADEPGDRSPFARLRLRAGLSQQQLADKVGMTQANISRIETGRQEPSIGTAALLSRALGISVDELAGALCLA